MPNLFERWSYSLYARSADLPFNLLMTCLKHESKSSKMIERFGQLLYVVLLGITGQAQRYAYVGRLSFDDEIATRPIALSECRF